MPRHRDFGAVRQHEFLMIAEFLDEAEDVVPASAVESRGVILQLIQNLVHLERGEYSLDQHRRANRSARHAQCVLREVEDIVPQARFQMALQLRQVKVWAGAVGDLLFRVVEEE